jgi:hypothetical protein
MVQRMRPSRRAHKLPLNGDWCNNAHFGLDDTGMDKHLCRVALSAYILPILSKLAILSNQVTDVT